MSTDNPTVRQRYKMAALTGLCHGMVDRYAQAFVVDYGDVLEALIEDGKPEEVLKRMYMNCVHKFFSNDENGNTEGDRLQTQVVNHAACIADAMLAEDAEHEKEKP